MRARTGALGLVVSLLLGGCANLPFFGAKDGAATSGEPTAASAAGAASAPAPDTHVEYRLEVQAPGPLRTLLLSYLDLARFQSAPAAEGISAPELERLLVAAPAQARGLLETEGYFNARVTVNKIEPQAVDAGLPLLRVVVEPGPRATVERVAIESVGALQDAAAAGDAGALRELARLRAQWPLGKGQAFRQADWADAKNATLARLRANGYAGASWQASQAQVDARSNHVDLTLTVLSGPLYRLGELRIEGLSRYDEASVRRLAVFGPGDPYSEKQLLDFQERLQKVGLFEGASVELVAEGSDPQAAPVLVRVKELPLQQATVGVGYSANTGPRVSLEHTQRRVFGSAWTATNKFIVGPQQQSWAGELSSHPLDGLYRNLVSGGASHLYADDQWLTSTNLRVGRAQETQRIERLAFAEVVHARVLSDTLTSEAQAVSGNFHWLLRDVDSVLLPTRGITLATQVGVGYARGSRSVAGDPQVDAKGPFARLYARLTWYRPVGDGWLANARLEAGEVFAHSAVGVPDTLLFRAGGEDSVRGYGYRTLGPEIKGVTLSGRTLVTGSVEIARPLVARYPDYLWAAFVDAGDAADRWNEIKPALGYGLGLRWRSPVGPLRVDLAYGEREKQLKLHLSVGVVF